MPRTFEEEDTKLLGYQTADVIADKPTHLVVDATAKAGVGHLTTRFIYFKATCSTSEAGRVVALHGTKGAHLLQPASRTQKEVRGLPINQVGDFVLKKLISDFRAYLHARVDAVTDTNFIPPSDSTTPARTGQHVMRDIESYLANAAGHEGQLKVLMAPAGVGKTTVSRRIVHDLARSALARSASGTTTIPIFVESQHWKGLPLSSISGLYEIIRHSMQLFGATSVTEEVYAHALRQRYVSFIFDGFDELCSDESARFDALDTLRNLLELSRYSARIMITTRTGFWNSLAWQDVVTSKKDISLVTLVPFNTQQAKGYFGGVFQHRPDLRNRAVGLYGRLSKRAVPRNAGAVRDQIVNHPFFVHALAAYVKDSPAGNRGQDPSEPTIGSLLDSFCTREVERQKLATSASGQLNSFIDVALADTRHQPRFSLDDLCSLDGGFSELDQPKIALHPLILDAGGDFSFRYDFLAPYLRALGLRRWLHSGSPIHKGLERILVGEQRGVGEVSDHIDQLLGLDEIDLVVRRCHAAVDEGQMGVASFLLHVGQRLCSVRGLTNVARTRKLFFGGDGARELSGWSFWGTLRDLDLRDVSFRGCAFSDVEFVSCAVDGNTTFDQCVFDGTLSMDASWHVVNLRDTCTTHFPADSKWETVLKRDVGSREARALKLLELALRKFYPGGVFHERVKASVWQLGWKGESREARRVRELMLRAKLMEPVRIGGEKEDSYRFDRHSRAALQNFMDNRHRSGKVKVVFDDLI